MTPMMNMSVLDGDLCNIAAQGGVLVVFCGKLKTGGDGDSDGAVEVDGGVDETERRVTAVASAPY